MKLRAFLLVAAGVCFAGMVFDILLRVLAYGVAVAVLGLIGWGIYKATKQNPA